MEVRARSGRSVLRGASSAPERSHRAAHRRVLIPCQGASFDFYWWRFTAMTAAPMPRSNDASLRASLPSDGSSLCLARAIQNTALSGWTLCRQDSMTALFGYARPYGESVAMVGFPLLCAPMSAENNDLPPKTNTARKRSVNWRLMTPPSPPTPQVNEFVDEWDSKAGVARQEPLVDFCVNVTRRVCNWSADEREQCSANRLISESSSAMGACRPTVNRCAPLHIPANSTITATLERPNPCFHMGGLEASHLSQSSNRSLCSSE